MSIHDLKYIWDKIDTPKPGDGGCWNWNSELDQFGFGKLIVDNEVWLAHKYVYFHLNRYQDRNHPISQKCRNRKCCNPAHLILGFIPDDMWCYLGRAKKLYGPYTRKDGREHVVILLNDGSKITRSYPKFLIEYEYGIELDPSTETIDHVNRDFTNNSKSNIQILTRAENAKKSALRRKPVYSSCPICGIVFELTVNQISGSKRSKPKAGPFCSKKCSGLYGTKVQNNKINILNTEKIKIEYYRQDD